MTTMDANKQALDALERLANVPMQISLAEWQEIVRPIHAALTALVPVEGEVLPFDLRVGAGIFRKGVKVSTAQDAIDRLYKYATEAATKPAVPREVVTQAANHCRANRPSNYTHGYICGYLDGVSTMEKEALAIIEGKAANHESK
ncbi:MAG: hypothetical protein E6Q97_14825 [Desulfurellales bacterium]|nr:MAG: hypothetical protein E6Q97_14825 [Desulfurellales bacterium]